MTSFSGSLRSLVLIALVSGVGVTLSYARPATNRPLEQAACSGDLNAVKSLLPQETQTKSRGVSLMCAARNGYLEVVQYMVEHGVPIDANNNAREKTPLLAAAFRGHVEIVKYLVDKGADMNIQAINGWTPLHDAAYIGNVEIVKYLVDHGAKLDIRNEKNETPLATVQRAFRTGEVIKRGHTQATSQDYKTVIDYLKAHGAP